MIEEQRIIPLGLNIMKTDKFGVSKLQLIAVVGHTIESIYLIKENTHEHLDFNHPMSNALESRRKSFSWKVKGYVPHAPNFNCFNLLCNMGKQKSFHYKFKSNSNVITLYTFLLQLEEDIENIHPNLEQTKPYNDDITYIFVTTEAETIKYEKEINARIKNDKIFVLPSEEDFITNYMDRELMPYKTWYES